MTNDEFSKWMLRLFVAFPGIKEWFEGLSDPAGTQAIWRDCLRPFSFDECFSVLGEWCSGDRPAPKPYEREYVAIMCKQSILFDRDKHNQVNGAAEERFNFSREAAMERAAARRRSYQPTFMGSPGLKAAFLNGRELMGQRDRGEITVAEFERRKQQLIDAV